MDAECVRKAIRAILGYVPVNDLVLMNVMKWADPQGKGKIGQREFLLIKLKAMVYHGKQKCVLWYKNLDDDK